MRDMVARLSGADVIAAIKRSRVEYILSVPDISTSVELLWPIARDPDLRLIRVCKEDETIGISAGLWHCDRRAVLLFQHTGLLDSINAIRAVAVEYQLPICMMVGLLNKEPGVLPAASQSYGIRIVPPILDAMGIFNEWIETQDDLPKVAAAIERCYATPEPVVLLIGRSAAA
jgi:sulfopyruvate decarboxylase subunit alpha